MDCGEERKSASSQEREIQIYEKNWEELHCLSERGILVEVEHVKAHRTEQEKKNMSHFEKFVTEGHEKADKLAKAGAMLDEGYMAEAKAETMQQEREEVLLLCSMRPVFTAWWRNGKIGKTQAEAKRKVGFRG